MRHLILTSILCLTTACAYAAEQKYVNLKDGTRIKGEIVGMANGIYTVRTQTMGDVRVADSEIKDISVGLSTPEAPVNDTPSAPSGNITQSPEFKNIQSQVMGDPAVMGEIQKLIEDPEIMQIMSDPSFVAAIQSGNSAALQSDPRLKALSENPKVQALIQEIKAKQ